jgi:hypothetical protein
VAAVFVDAAAVVDAEVPPVALPADEAAAGGWTSSDEDEEEGADGGESDDSIPSLVDDHEARRAWASDARRARPWPSDRHARVAPAGWGTHHRRLRPLHAPLRGPPPFGRSHPAASTTFIYFN